MGLGLASSHADGSVMVPGKEARYVDRGVSTVSGQDLFSGRVLVPGVGIGFRDITVTPYIAPNGDNYGLIARHAYEDLFQYTSDLSFEIALGSNARYDRGQIVSISSYEAHPTADLAWLKFSENVLTSGPTEIGTVSYQETVNVSGFGRSATVGDATSFIDYNPRSWEMKVISGQDGGQNIVLSFTPSNGLDLAGKGYIGDSSGPVYNTDGHLVGIILTQSGDLGPVGANGVLGLSPLRSWLPIPEPSSALVLLGAGLFFLQRRDN